MQRFLSKVIFFCFSLINSLHGLTTSIIVPCYPGHVQYLPELINAYGDQTVLPDEMIISFSEVNEINERDLRSLYNCIPKFPINIVTAEEKLYAGQNRNAACKVAIGDIFICQDADDLPHPQRIELIKKSFEQNKISILLHRWMPSSEKSKLNHVYNFKTIILYKIKYWKDHQIVDYIHYGNVSIRREVFDKVQWNDRKNAEDVSFVEEVMRQRFTLGILNAYLLVYRSEFSSGN